MSAKLPVTADRNVFGVDVNVSNRIEVFDAAGADFEITNVPDVTPALGGQFPVYEADGTERLISFVDVVGPVVDSFVGMSPGDAGQGADYAYHP